MKGQFFIIATIVIISSLSLIIRYLYDFNKINLTKLEEMHELNYIQYIKESYKDNILSVLSNDGCDKLEADLNYTTKFLKNNLNKKGIIMLTEGPSIETQCSSIELNFSLISSEFYTKTQYLLLPLIIHDVAIFSIIPERSYIHDHEACTLNITVIAKNEGIEIETFNVATYYNNTTSYSIGTQTVRNLNFGSDKTLNFTWDANGVASCRDYTISATASIVPGEIDTTDNSLIDDKVKVRLRGDANGDGVVNFVDVGVVSAHWYPGPPIGPLGYDPTADLNCDGVVNFVDAGIVSANWGHHC